MVYIRNATVAYCGGTFDILHPGHVKFFRWASENFDRVLVSLNTDAFITSYKGAPPVQPFEERWDMVSSCRWVDYVTVNVGGADSKPAIRAACPRPTHLVNGSDWSRDRLMQQMGLTESFLSENGLSIVLCPLAREFSSTELKARIKNA